MLTSSRSAPAWGSVPHIDIFLISARVFIWRRLGNGRNGCGWTGCWGSWAFEGTTRRGGGSFGRRWSRGGGLRAEGHADEEMWSGIRREWRFGAEDFLERLMETGVAEKADRGIHEGAAVSETLEEKARRLIADYLRKRKTDIGELRARRKADPMEIKLAAKLRKHTTRSMGWIAGELNAGTPGSVWNALGKAGKESR
jgi:hypothetical protein